MIVFLLVHLAPGSPVSGGGDALRRPTGRAAEELRRLYGLDRPIPERFGAWFSRAVRFDLGESFVDRRPVGERIREALPNTLFLNGLALALALSIAIPLGVVAGGRPEGPFDRLSGAALFALYSTPTFWAALLLQSLFAVQLRLAAALRRRLGPGACGARGPRRPAGARGPSRDVPGLRDARVRGAPRALGSGRDARSRLRAGGPGAGRVPRGGRSGPTPFRTPFCRCSRSSAFCCRRFSRAASSSSGFSPGRAWAGCISIRSSRGTTRSSSAFRSCRRSPRSRPRSRPTSRPPPRIRAYATGRRRERVEGPHRILAKTAGERPRRARGRPAVCGSSRPARRSSPSGRARSGSANGWRPRPPRIPSARTTSAATSSRASSARLRSPSRSVSWPPRSRSGSASPWALRRGGSAGESTSLCRD